MAPFCDFKGWFHNFPNIYSTAQEPFMAEIRWLHDYTYLTFTGNSNNCCKVEKIYK
jgi:hypothetical protein